VKTKTLKTFALEVTFIITCIIVGFSGFNKCDAQSIVGKWNQISSKQFLTAEGSKKLGKSVLETQMTSIGTIVFPKTTISINGNTMVTSTLYPDSKITTKIEITLTRL